MAVMYEEKLIDLKRKGDLEKVKWLENISQHVRESQKRRIQANDKSVLGELVLPKWVSWELLRDWAAGELREIERRCIACGELDTLGIDFKEKFFCEKCFLALKNLV